VEDQVIKLFGKSWNICQDERAFSLKYGNDVATVWFSEGHHMGGIEAIASLVSEIN